MTAALPAITRPNGRVYRPRKPPAGSYLDTGDEDGVVLILRTHDVAAHQAWAQQLWRQETGDDVPLHGGACWMRLVPWDATGHGGDSTWVDVDGNDPRGCPAVEYRPARQPAETRTSAASTRYHDPSTGGPVPAAQLTGGHL